MKLRISCPVTSALLAINSLVFLYLRVVLDASDLAYFTFEWGLHPDSFWGSYKIWQPLTALFVHQDPVHFAVNMLGLWTAGSALERTIGSARFGWLYMISGLTGSVFLLAFNADLQVGAHGASGAISGLLGALAIFYPRSQLLFFFVPMRAVFAAVLFAALSLLFYLLDLFPMFAHMAHLGGLLGGAAYAKFALQLNIGTGELEGAPQRAVNRDAEILRVLQNAPPPVVPPDRRGVTSPVASASDLTPAPPAVSPTDVGVAKPNGDSGDKRLHYDPATGRFFLQ